MTLTELSYYLRRAIPYVIVGFVFFILFYFLIKSFLGYLESRKVIPLPINPIFNKVPKFKVKTNINYPLNAEFILDNIEGRPVTATESAKVFYLPPTSARFGYLQNIYLSAKNLGFDTENIKHKTEDTRAIFDDDEKSYEVDIANFNFEYLYKFEERSDLFTVTNLPSERQIKENAKDFLRSAGRYPEELAKGKENVVYLNYDVDLKEFKPVKKPSDANTVEVDFFRPDIDSFGMVSPRYFNSSNFVVMTLKEKDYMVIKAQIKFFEKEDKTFGIYPIKSGNQAFEDLKLGGAIIVSAGQNSNRITIKKMFLGYFDPDFYQPYLQPVYVFLGEGGFAAYVPAILDDYGE